MNNKKDWSYFEFKVGRYEPYQRYDINKKKYVSEEGFIPYKPETKRLVWYVFDNDFNAKAIVPLNVFEGSISFIYGLVNAKKKYKDNYFKFAEEVRSCLQYAYWSKFEWETIITSWPPYVDGEEIDRLSKEKEKRIRSGNHFYHEDVSLETAFKIDIYTQVMMNWDRFIEYVWNNKKLITKKKLGITW